MPDYDFLADLPAPQDDEPQSLRDNIVDELADHLHCSLRKELLKNADELFAEQRVLDRFGNPKQLARRLWWQAMWSHIMRQRILSGLQWILTLAAVGLSAAVLWQQATLMNELRIARAEQRAEQQALSLALKQLLPEQPPRLAEAKPDFRPPDDGVQAPPPMLNDSPSYFYPDSLPPAPALIVNLVQETADGPPIVDALVELGAGETVRTAAMERYRRRDKARSEILPNDGRARDENQAGNSVPELEDVFTGRYVLQLDRADRIEFSVELPDGQRCRQSVLVRANEQRELTIICPKPRETAIVHVTVPSLPKELQRHKFEFQIEFDDAFITFDGVRWWTPRKEPQHVMFDLENGLIEKICRQDGSQVINLRNTKPEERAIIVLSGPLQYRCRLELVGTNQASVWPKRSDDQQLIQEIDPGESFWKLEFPEELIAETKSFFGPSALEAALSNAYAAPAFAPSADAAKAKAANEPLEDRCRLIVKLTSETKDGPAPEGARLCLIDDQNIIIDQFEVKQNRVWHGGRTLAPDADNLCVFNQIELGRYTLNVKLGDGRETTIKLPALRPGQIKSEHIVCPPSRSKAMLLVTASPVPDELRKQDISLKMWLISMDVKLDGRKWTFGQPAVVDLAFDPETGLLDHVDDRDLRNESPEDRLLFLPTGPYSMTLVAERPLDRKGGMFESLNQFPSDEEAPNDEPDFTAAKGENKWEIKTPNGFWDAVRTKLAESK